MPQQLKNEQGRSSKGGSACATRNTLLGRQHCSQEHRTQIRISIYQISLGSGRFHDDGWDKTTFSQQVERYLLSDNFEELSIKRNIYLSTTHHEKFNLNSMMLSLR